MPVKPHRSPQQQQPEDQEHERQLRQQSRPQSDEHCSQGQRGDDAEDEHPLLMLAGHSERGHYDHEDEEVIDRQTLLDDVAREVLGAVPPPHEAGEYQAEGHGHRDIQRRPRGSLPVANRVRAHRGQQQVQRQQRRDHTDRQRPADRRDHHCGPPGTRQPSTVEC